MSEAPTVSPPAAPPREPMSPVRVEPQRGPEVARDAEKDAVAFGLVKDLKAVTGSWPEYRDAVFAKYRTNTGRASMEKVFFNRSGSVYFIQEGTLGRNDEYFDLGILNPKFNNLGPEDMERIARNVAPSSIVEALKEDKLGIFETEIRVDYRGNTTDPRDKSSVQFHDSEISAPSKTVDGTILPGTEVDTLRAVEAASRFRDRLLMDNPQTPVPGNPTTITADYKVLPPK